MNLILAMSLCKAPPPGVGSGVIVHKRHVSCISKFSASEFPSVTLEDPDGNLSCVSAYLPYSSHSYEEYVLSCSRLHETCAHLSAYNKLYVGMDANVQMIANLTPAVVANVSGQGAPAARALILSALADSLGLRLANTRFSRDDQCEHTHFAWNGGNASQIDLLLIAINVEVHSLDVLEIHACTDHRAIVADIPVAPKPVAVFRSSRKNWFLPEKLKVPVDSSLHDLLRFLMGRSSMIMCCWTSVLTLLLLSNLKRATG